MGGQKGDFRGRVYIIMTDSLCCMAETNIKKSNFPPIKKLCVFFFLRNQFHWSTGTYGSFPEAVKSF